jgi:hypothetical protein
MSGEASYQVRFTDRGKYLHAAVTGANTRDNVLRYLADVRRECEVRNCTRVLIEERLEGPRLGFPDVFRIAAEGSTRALGFFEAIAYVDVHAQGDLMDFAETVAVNRAMPVRVFRSLPDAENWLDAPL